MRPAPGHGRLFTASERDATAARVAALLEADERLSGLALVGSSAGGGDRWSDVDAAALVAPGGDAAALADTWVERLTAELAAAHHFRTAFGATEVAGLLLPHGLEVDLSFTPEAKFVVWGPARRAFDRSGALTAALRRPERWTPGPPDVPRAAGFAWHDVLHACSCARRGRLWQAHWYLERVRDATLSLAARRHGRPDDFFEGVDDAPSAETQPLQAALATELEAGEILRATEAATLALLDELARWDADLAQRLRPPLLLHLRGA